MTRPLSVNIGHFYVTNYISTGTKTKNFPSAGDAIEGNQFLFARENQVFGIKRRIYRLTFED